MQRKFWIKGAVLALVLIGGAGTYWAFSSSTTLPSEKIAAPLHVSRQSLREVVTAEGTLEPKNYVDVGVQVSGQLKKLHGDIGDHVKIGDLVAELDPAPYETRVAADEAKLNALKAQRAQKVAERDLNKILADRAALLIKTKAISQEEMDTKAATLRISEAAITALEAQCAEAEANLTSDKINLGYTKIYAPMDGIIADQTAREGQTLNANQTTPKILQIADLSVMTVRAEVAEADVMRLKPSMEARFSTLGAMETQWKGTIRQILPTPQVVNDVVLYNVLIDVDNKDYVLMNGMSTQVSFDIARADQALSLPIEALGKRREDLDQKDAKAYEVSLLPPSSSPAKPEIKIVHVGVMTRQFVEIKSGLSENDAVVPPSDTPTQKTSGNGSKPRMMPPSMGPRL